MINKIMINKHKYVNIYILSQPLTVISQVMQYDLYIAPVMITIKK